jgi:hypothetical protein
MRVKASVGGVAEFMLRSNMTPTRLPGASRRVTR